MEPTNHHPSLTNQPWATQTLCETEAGRLASSAKGWLVFLFIFEADDCSDNQQGGNLPQPKVGPRSPVWKLHTLSVEWNSVDNPSETYLFSAL